jgi:hypothetical protein
MLQINLSELALAYLFAGAVIGLLMFFARQNQKQGWQKRRTSWYESRTAAIVETFTAPPQPAASNEVLLHMGDLSRLRSALSAHGESTRPEPVAPSREKVERSR